MRDGPPAPGLPARAVGAVTLYRRRDPTSRGRPGRDRPRPAVLPAVARAPAGARCTPEAAVESDMVIRSSVVVKAYLTGQDGTHRGRPPLAAAVRGRRSACVEVAGDLGEALARGAFCADALGELGREDCGASARAGGALACAWWSAAFGEEPFELVDGMTLVPQGSSINSMYGCSRSASVRSTSWAGSCSSRRERETVRSGSVRFSV